MFTTQHYKEVAHVFSDNEHSGNSDMEAMRWTLARGMADMFECDSSRFKRDMFLAACHVPVTETR